MNNIRISKCCGRSHISGRIEDFYVYAAKIYDESSRIIAHGIKEHDIDSIRKAAKEMAHMIPKNSVLVPIPSRYGKAYSTHALACHLSIECHGKFVYVSDVLEGNKRRSNYICKLEGNPLKEEDLGFKMNFEDFEEAENVVFIDNVFDTGVTAMAAAHAYGKPCYVMVYAITPKALG